MVSCECVNFAAGENREVNVSNGFRVSGPMVFFFASGVSDDVALVLETATLDVLLLDCVDGDCVRRKLLDNEEDELCVRADYPKVDESV